MTREFNLSQNGLQIIEKLDRPYGSATRQGHLAYHQLHLSFDDSELINDGTDTETVTISVVDGLEVARGTDTANATVLAYDGGDVTVSVDGVETTKTLSGGTVSFDLTTTKSAGSEIVVEAVGLSDRPAESDSATIEVVSA